MNRTNLIVTAALTLAAAGLLYGGPLNPPAGGVASTGKTLTEVEPRTAINATNTPGDATSLYKIIQPGSYYLTGNIGGVSGKNGIEVAAAGVTLDLNGFTLRGVPGSLDGISTIYGLLTVRNGTISSWGSDGIDLNTSGDQIIQGVSVLSNAGRGIAANNNANISDCLAESNGLDGIATGSNSIVRHCITSFNTGSGISVMIGTLVKDCACAQNALDGIRLIGGAARVQGNVCTFNGLGATVGAGIRSMSQGNRLEDNQCINNDIGIKVDASQPGNFMSRNVCKFNSTLNWDVSAGNYGLVVSATPGAAFTGNSGGVTPGSTDPNANFSY